jgi:hypothetical protein
VKTATNVARFALLGSGALLLVLGLTIWISKSDVLVPIHEELGYLLVLSLWTIAAIAARSGVSGRLVAGAFAWSIVAITLGLSQEFLLTGSWHWTIQVSHVVVSMGVIAWGQRLVSLIRKHESAAGLSRPVPPVHSVA